MDKDVRCNTTGNGGCWARRGFHFSAGDDPRGAFDTSAGAYDDLPNQVEADRPITNMNLSWDVIGYVYMNDTASPHVTASITMDGTRTGIFIHSGLAVRASDWIKGYISTALAVEEARAYVTNPAFLTQEVGNVHGVVFSTTLLAGGWGEGVEYFPEIGSHHFTYVQLMLTIPNHYKHVLGWLAGSWTNATLSVADFRLFSPDTGIYAEIDLARAGWETRNPNSSLMNKIGWWAVGFAASTLSMLIGIPYLGSAVGVVPMLVTAPTPPDTRSIGRADAGVWANGTSIDPNKDDWGTVSMCFKVKFLYTHKDYTFSLRMASWVQFVTELSTKTRYSGIPFSTELTFSVLG